MTKTCSGVLVAFVLAGCGSDAPPGAAVAKDVNVKFDDSPLVRLQDVSLIRAGDSFTLAGYDGSQVHWGRLSLDGKLTLEPSFAMAQPVVGPVFAATMKTSPGDQLVAIAFVNSSTVSGGYDLVATVHTLGAAAPAAPIVLAPPLPAGTDPTTVQLAAGAAVSGVVGYVAWGIRVPGISVSYLLLPADAITTAAPSKMFDDSVPEWDCLAPSVRPAGLGFSVVTPDSANAASNFETAEIDDAGNPIFMTYQLTVAVVSCRIVGSAASSGRYVMALQGIESDSTAIDFAIYYPDSGSVTTQHPVLPAALFGDPMSMPRPAWVSSAGGDVVIGLARTAGPQVVRYSYNGIPHGSTLTLRSANGHTGPVAAWVGADAAAYVTYSDQVKSGSSTTFQRYFMRIDSPASLP